MQFFKICLILIQNWKTHETNVCSTILGGCWREKVVSTSSASNQKRRPLFHANIPPKWWIRHLFHAFSNFGWVLSKFWKIAFFGPFWAVFLWARTQKLAGDVRGQFKSQWLNPNIFEFSEGSVTTISACHLKILMSRVFVHFLATPRPTPPPHLPASKSHLTI